MEKTLMFIAAFFVLTFAQILSAKTAIVILGAPRGGTSCTAGIVSQMVVDLGKQAHLKPADAGNAKGYFENTRIMDLNEKILQRYQTSVTKALPIDIDDLNQFNEIVDEIVELIKAEFDLTNERDILLKDVRMPLLLPFYDAALRALNFVVKYIWVTRPHEYSARSAQEFPFTEEDIKNLGQDQIDCIRKHAPSVCEAIATTFAKEINRYVVKTGLPLFTFAYTDLLEAPRKIAENMAAFLVDVKAPDNFLSKVEQFVDPQLCHHRAAETR